MKHTREQLDGMSDFERNKLLGKLANPSAIISRSINGYDSVTIESADGCRIMVDYCNNWNDIMPLAVEYGVSIEKNPLRKEWVARSCNHDHSELMFRCFIHKSPQRAITCCLIMVLEAKL